MKLGVIDSLKSMIGSLGDSNRDKSAATGFVDIRLTDNVLSIMYRNSWMARKIVDIPAKDALRKWRTWEEHKEEMEKEETRLHLKTKLLAAYKKNRLYGGSALFIGTDQDSSEPLDPDTIKKGGVEYLTVFNKSDISPDTRISDPLNPMYGRPEFYTLTNSHTKVHYTRLVLFHTDDVLDEQNAAELNSWNDSVLKPCYTAIKEATSTFSNVASLVFESNVDVIKFPDFMKKVGEKEEEQKFVKRMTLASAAKGINGTLMMDAKEEYERKEISFSQLPDIMDRMIQVTAASGDIPATRFIGISPRGFDSTGESDMLNYQDNLQSEQKLVITPALAILDKCLVNSAGITEEIEYEWNPLRQMDELEISEISKNTTNAIKTISELGGGSSFSPQELRDLAIHKLTENKSFPHMKQFMGKTAPESAPETDKAVAQAIADGRAPDVVLYNILDHKGIFKDTNIKSYEDYRKEIDKQ